MKQNNRTIGVLLLLWACVVPFSLSSADDDAAKAEPAAKTRIWNLGITGGITLNSGNTQNTMFQAGLDFKLDIKRFNFKSKVEGNYGTSQKEEIVNQGIWSSKLSAKFLKKINALASADFEYDNFSNISLRSGIGLGLKYLIVDKANVKTDIAASLQGEFTRAIDDTPFKRSLRFNVNYSLDFKINGTSNLSMTTLWTSNVDDFTNDYRFGVYSELKVLMKKPLWLKIKVRDKYTNLPQEGVLKKNDLMLVTALEIQF